MSQLHDKPAESSIAHLMVSRPDLFVARGSVVQQLAWLSEWHPDRRFQLVYLDPPFYSNKDYGSFSDEWTSLNDYLGEVGGWMSAISPWIDDAGFFVLHCDYHASHYLKVAGDRVFGYNNFRNEWIWHYSGRRIPAGRHVNSKHDVLLVWAKSARSRFNPVFEPWDRRSYVAMKRQQVHVDEAGREWIWGHQGKGKSHAYRIYLDEHVERGRAIDSVWDIPIINTSAKERVGYPTQKPVRLLTRIIELTTREGDWIADFAAGSGTTAVGALRLNRRVWIGDRSEEAVNLAMDRIMQEEIGRASNGPSNGE
jgi:site-specific DNA-methyltransferase (adenine-specific)